MWVYEPAGAVHEATSHPEDTVYLANVRGPIAYHGPDGKVTHVSNAETMKNAIANRSLTSVGAKTKTKTKTKN